MALLLRRCIIALNIHKKIKTCEKSIITIKPTDEDLDKKNDLNEEDSKNNILLKIIKLFFNKKPSFDSLNDKKLKLFFSLFLRRL